MWTSLWFCLFSKENNFWTTENLTSTSGHQNHTINNFIWGELWSYVSFNTLEKIFSKVERKFIIRLRNRGYKKVFLLRLFSKIKFGSRNRLLAISADNENYREIGNNRSVMNLVNDAERMFQMKFQWKIIKTKMPILLVSLLLYLCVVNQRLFVG